MCAHASSVMGPALCLHHHPFTALHCWTNVRHYPWVRFPQGERAHTHFSEAQREVILINSSFFYILKKKKFYKWQKWIQLAQNNVSHQCNLMMQRNQIHFHLFISLWGAGLRVDRALHYWHHGALCRRGQWGGLHHQKREQFAGKLGNVWKMMHG